MYSSITTEIMLFLYLSLWSSFVAASIDSANEQVPQLLILPPILDEGHGDAKTVDHEFVGYLKPFTFSLSLLIHIAVFAAHFPPWNISRSLSTQKT